jgi:DNA-binding response OmpR family regulator
MTALTNSRRFSVLVVDDDHDSADSMALFLRLSGHDARAAYGGEQALATHAERPADVAILDVVMNGVGGIELASRLRMAAVRPLLLVAVTGVGTKDEVAAVKAGAFDYLYLKPVDPNELLGLLDARACRRQPVTA